MNEHFFLLEDSLNSLQHALLSEKLHANLYAPLRFYTLLYIELRRHKIKK